MNIMNLFYLMATIDSMDDPTAFCGTLTPVWTIVGYVIFAIKIVVPLLLIVTGMLTLAQAVMKKEEKDIKAAQNLLIKKIIAAVLVFFVITIVTLVVGLVYQDGDWNECVKCAIHPFEKKNSCYVLDKPASSTTNTDTTTGDN